mmetsp:Transcript_7937/g.21452  ORF Transcript_7937/g.21452 Transcript_7937/m.21452 type:complete len:472 (-) Transcript_7937:518-1933(-)
MPAHSFLRSSLRTPAAYTLPAWAQGKFKNLPTNGRLSLGNLPTPVYQITPAPQDDVTQDSTILGALRKHDIKLWIKRDDMSGGVELGGNKVRKLEFLLAEACAQGHKSVVTIGGEQSNHCGATATAARMLGMKPHLILRTHRADDIDASGSSATTPTTTLQNGIATDSFGAVGNVLIDRVVGSSIYACTPEENAHVGSHTMVQRLADYLEQEEGERPYCVPVGGSNGLGTWGYINAVDELSHQLEQTGAHTEGDDRSSAVTFDHVVVASGSGGTAAGLAIGFALCPSLQSVHLHAIGVCDNPDYFYRTMAKIVTEGMGYSPTGEAFGGDGDAPSAGDDPDDMESFLRRRVTVHQGQGLGYAVSSTQELRFMEQFAMETGIVLDPVCSGKALYHFFQNVLSTTTIDSAGEDDDATQSDSPYQGCNILFWHTGGALSMFDKVDDLQLPQNSPVTRLCLDNGSRNDGSSRGIFI